MPSYTLSPVGGAGAQFFNNSGVPLAGGKLYTYQAGTTTPQTTYTTNAGNVAHSNPIILDSSGRVPNGGEIWLLIATNYKFVLNTSTDVLIATWDNITGINGTGIASNASVIQYDPAGTGAVSTTVQAKLRQTVSIKDFGAVGDGITNDTTAWKAFVNYLVANGGTGLLNAGTYLVDSWSPDLTGNAPFEIIGDGQNVSILKNRTPNNSFFYTSNGNNITLSDFTMNGDYTGTPAAATAGGNLVFVNSNHITLRNIDFVSFRRVAVMMYNDHQDTPTNVYKDVVIENCNAYGNNDYSNNVGPSAFLIADIDYVRIEGCYIENIGLYGYELKNDCNYGIITNCTGQNVFYGIYFGGDGALTSLGYVKRANVSNCSFKNVYEAVAMGRASYNIVDSILVDNSDTANSYFTVDVRNNSNNNSITNIVVHGTNYTLCTIKDTSLNNYIEFSEIIQGAATDRGITGITADCSGNTIIFGNRDSTQAMFINSYVLSNNTVVDKQTNTASYSPAVNQLISTRFTDTGVPPLYSTSKGVAYAGTYMDEFYTTAQTSQYKYIGNFTKPDIVAQRSKLDTGAYILYLYNTGSATTETFTWQTGSYYPENDGAVNLGTGSRRWQTVYATSGSINTSDGREKQQIRTLSDKEKAVAVKLKSLIRAFKFNDAADKKSDAARIHFGVIAQDVKAAFESEGLIAEQYGMFCYDEWPEQQEEKDNNGNVVVPYRPAGNRYGIRYDELFAFIIGAM